MSYLRRVIKNSVNAAGDITTTSTSYVVVTSLTITPVAGNYIAMFDSGVTHDTNNEKVYYAIFVNGVQVTNSERIFTCQNAAERNAATTHVNNITVDGTQAVDVRWKVDVGTGTMGNRILTLIRLT